MIRPKRNMRLFGVAGALCALAAAPAAHAQIITPTFTLSGGLYHYNYTVLDNTLTSFSDIAMNLTPGTSILNPIAPVGYATDYDPGSGIFDFVSGTSPSGGIQDFTPGSLVSGFTFDCPSLLPAAPFTAYDDNLNATPGTTLAPRAAAVPEPGTLALALLAAPGLLLIARRRRATLSSDPLTQGDHTA